MGNLNQVNNNSNKKNGQLTDVLSSKSQSLNSYPSSNYTNISNGSILSTPSNYFQQSSALNSIALPSLCQFTNESILDFETSSIANKQRKTAAEAVLGVIAGIGV